MSSRISKRASFAAIVAATGFSGKNDANGSFVQMSPGVMLLTLAEANRGLRNNKAVL